MILGEVKRYIRDNSVLRVSRSIKDLAYKTLRLKEELTTSNGVEPTDAEVAKILNVTEYEISNALESLREPMSMYEPIYNDGGDTIYLFDQISNKEDEYGLDYKLAVDKAMNRPTSMDDIYDKLNKLGDTVYKFDILDIDIDNDIFIPLKELNDIRREAISKLNELRLYKSDVLVSEYNITVPDFDKVRGRNVLVSNKEDLDKLDRNYDIVFCEELVDKTILKLPRVILEYPDMDNVMIGDIGGFNKYKNVYTDFSLNVTNSYTVAFLHSLGAKMVTLSYELNDKQIKEIIDNYHERYGKHPNIEVIVSGYEEVMVSKFSLNKYYNSDKLYLKDMFGNKYKISNKNGLMYIYNYKKREIYSERYYEMGVNYLRFNLDK